MVGASSRKSTCNVVLDKLRFGFIIIIFVGLFVVGVTGGVNGGGGAASSNKIVDRGDDEDSVVVVVVAAADTIGSVDEDENTGGGEITDKVRIRPNEPILPLLLR